MEDWVEGFVERMENEMADLIDPEVDSIANRNLEEEFKRAIDVTH